MLWEYSPSPPPPPPPPPPLKPVQNGDSGHHSLLIITAIILFVIITSISIHLLLRLLSSSSISSSSPSNPTISTVQSIPNQDHQKILIDSLPIFSLSSSLLKSSSLDCAVCLSPFNPDDQLRLLPSCRHAFHSSCIDTWLTSTPTCPLCRSSIIHHHPPDPTVDTTTPSRSASFRIEIGSVSRRTNPSEEEEDDLSFPLPPPPHVRTYSLGSSFEYRTEEEEVEAVIEHVRRRRRAETVKEEAVAAPGEEMAGGVGGGGRNWLKEYVDRIASSASSSFSSIRFSGRWSHRYDGGGEVLDLEGNRHLEEDDGAFSGFYSWLVGV